MVKKDEITLEKIAQICYNIIDAIWEIIGNETGKNNN